MPCWPVSQNDLEYPSTEEKDCIPGGLYTGDSDALLPVLSVMCVLATSTLAECAGVSVGMRVCGCVSD